jgi:DNA-binding CsgD family transcriptional regulator
MELFTAVLGDADFISMRDIRPQELTGYLQQFTIDFLVIAHPKLPDKDKIVQLLNGLVNAGAGGHSAAAIVAERLNLSKPLSQRQWSVLQYLRNGCTNKQIAEYMNVQPRTVKEWMKDLCLIFFVTNRTELVARFDELNQESSGEATKQEH